VTLLRAALAAGAPVESVFVGAGGRADAEVVTILEEALGRGARVFDLAPGVLERVADTVTPQPLLAVAAMPAATLAALPADPFVVLCADVRDPGNAGAVIRVADAAGADAVVCATGTVDPFNPKTVRASAGSVLHLPVVVADEPPAAVLGDLGHRGLVRVAAVARGGTPYTEAPLETPLALVFGNEAHGVPAPLGEVLDGAVTIPLAGGAESLNVSTAAAVLCFEVARRRSNLHAMRGAR